MWIDAHAHLDGFNDEALDRAITAAAQHDVHRIVNTATSLDSSHRVVEQVRRSPSLAAVVGVSPFDAPSCRGEWIAELEVLARLPEVVAIGEAGLDATNPRYPPQSLQLPVLEAQMELARTLNLGLVVHSRGAEREMVKRCSEAGLRNVLFHCFTATMQTLDLVLSAGYDVSFSGIITFPRSGLDEQVRATPAQRLFLETDTPYLSPVPYRGSTNEPARVARVGAHAAHLRGTDPQELACQLSRNAERFFSLFPAPGSDVD